ncbi:MAG TPA: hypothetical protein VGB82_01815 [Alphaproteobacteria bacterium]
MLDRLGFSFVMPAKAGIHRAAEPWIARTCAAFAAFKAADGREEKTGRAMTKKQTVGP